MALRPVSGLDLNRFEALFGEGPDESFLDQMREQSLAVVQDHQLKLTAQGRVMADYIAGQLSPY